VLQQAREIFERLGAAPALAETDALQQQAIALSSQRRARGAALYRWAPNDAATAKATMRAITVTMTVIRTHFVCFNLSPPQGSGFYIRSLK
jgi:hypothetical protein